MKYLKLFEQFINEAFNLEKMYQDHNIIKPLQEYADKVVSDATKNKSNIPSDIKIDKVKFWVTRTLKNHILNQIKDMLNDYYQKGKTDSNEFLEYKASLDYFKGNDKYKKSLNKLIERGSVESEEKFLESVIPNYLRVLFEREIKPKITTIFDWLFSSVREIENIDFNKSNLNDLYSRATEWHEELKATGEIRDEAGDIIKKYKDGYYWIDLETSDCDIEGEAMGHCGRTTADTLLSLRHIKKTGRIEPHVTMAVDYENKSEKKYDTIYQIKGKENTKPISKYHKYIVDFFLDENSGDNKKISLNEYSPENDFHFSDLKDIELIKKTLKAGYYHIHDANIDENDELRELILKEKDDLLNNGKLSNADLIYLYEKNLINKEDLKNNIEDVYFIDNNVYLKLGEIKTIRSENIIGLFKGVDIYYQPEPDNEQITVNYSDNTYSINSIAEELTLTQPPDSKIYSELYQCFDDVMEYQIDEIISNNLYEHLNTKNIERIQNDIKNLLNIKSFEELKNDEKLMEDLKLYIGFNETHDYDDVIEWIKQEKNIRKIIVEFDTVDHLIEFKIENIYKEILFENFISKLKDSVASDIKTDFYLIVQGKTAYMEYNKVWGEFNDKYFNDRGSLKDDFKTFYDIENQELDGNEYQDIYYDYIISLSKNIDYSFNNLKVDEEKLNRMIQKAFS